MNKNQYVCRIDVQMTGLALGTFECATVGVKYKALKALNN